MFNQNVGVFHRYLKEYCFVVRENIAQRNFVSNEYYKNKILINEKKTQKLGLDPKFWELDEELIKMNDLTQEQVLSNPDISRRFILTNVLLLGNFEIEKIRGRVCEF